MQRMEELLVAEKKANEAFDVATQAKRKQRVILTNICNNYARLGGLQASKEVYQELKHNAAPFDDVVTRIQTKNHSKQLGTISTLLTVFCALLLHYGYQQSDYYFAGCVLAGFFACVYNI